MLFVRGAVYNQVPEDYGIEIKAEAVSQLLPFFSVALPRVQHAALWSLERIAEDQSPGKPPCYKVASIFYPLLPWQSGKVELAIV